MIDAHTFLKARKLSFCTSAGQVLLRDVSFDLPHGTVLAIAGPNGAGKTTLLNILAGLTEASAGSVSLDGQDINQLPPAQRANLIALVSQQSAPDTRLPLRDYVALGQMPIWAESSKQTHQDDLNRILELTGLQPLAHKSI